MKFLSVCSGIEAASLAWLPLGWKAVGFSEIEPFASALLAHRFPNIPNFGDMTLYDRWKPEPFDLLCGGTPCQAFSVAGLRKGLSDPRGNLALVFLGIVERFKPRWIVWENVPGVLSSLSHDAPDTSGFEAGEGSYFEETLYYNAEELHAFNAFLAGLSVLGYGWSYRVLDAQFFGVPQRRQRIFLVGHLGGWTRPAAVLFEPESVRRNYSARRETGEAIAGTLSARASAGGGIGTDFELAGGLQIAHTLRGKGFDASEDGTGRGTPLICGALCANGKAAGSATQQSAESGHLIVPAITSKWAKGTGGPAGDECQNLIAGTLTTGSGGGRYDKQPMVAVPLTCNQYSDRASEESKLVSTAFNYNQSGNTKLGMSLSGVPPVRAQSAIAVSGQMGVRRLTPRECERLQGMPDDWTLVPYRGKKATDSPRYRAIGNSWAVPVARWIGERIAFVETL